MSRPVRPPPRCPFQNRGLTRHASLDSTLQTIQENSNLFDEEPSRNLSHGSLLDGQPLWYDDLLTDPEISPKGLSLCRSSSDPVTLLDLATSFHGPMFPVDEEEEEEEGAVSDGSPDKPREHEGVIKAGHGFEAGSCVYGPNSPRQMAKLTNSESSMVTALLESVPRNPLQYLTVDCSSASMTSESNGIEDVRNTFHSDSEKLCRRRSGQRSRVRKLQYIAELERTVDVLQTLGADLAARVASLFQNRAALSVENKRLRQQISSLRQEKIFMDGQYQSLKKEADRLKMISGRHRRSKSAASCFDMGPSVMDPSAINWQMLDMGKLSLGGNPVP